MKTTKVQSWCPKIESAYKVVALKTDKQRRSLPWNRKRQQGRLVKKSSQVQVIFKRKIKVEGNPKKLWKISYIQERCSRVKKKTNCCLWIYHSCSNSISSWWKTICGSRVLIFTVVLRLVYLFHNQFCSSSRKFLQTLFKRSKWISSNANKNYFCFFLSDLAPINWSLCITQPTTN